ncbi:MAG: radical SAM protein [Gemmatimonadota bacterium]|nr:radical SAM protein [Gemmatimonadota bacterium]
MLDVAPTDPRTLPTAARVEWRATRACDRACPGCPLGSPRWRDPHELSTIEAMLLANRLWARGCALLRVTGGDPSRREDLEDLVRHATRLGIEVEVALPTGVPPPGDERLRRLRESGVARIVARACGEAADADHTADVIATARKAGLPAIVEGAREHPTTITSYGEVLETVAG